MVFLLVNICINVPYWLEFLFSINKQFLAKDGQAVIVNIRKLLVYLGHRVFYISYTFLIFFTLVRQKKVYKY